MPLLEKKRKIYGVDTASFSLKALESASEGAKSKTYAVQIKSEEHQKQADFEKTERLSSFITEQKIINHFLKR